MKKGLKVVIGVIIILIIALVLLRAFWPVGTGDTLTSPAVKQSGTIKIGVSLPMTGEAASFGQAGIAGIELALEEIKQQGWIDGREVELVIEDDLCNPRGGVEAMKKLTTINDVDAVIGPICSAAGGASLPIAQERGTPTVFWASAPHLPKIGDYVFRAYPSDAFQGAFAAEYLYNKMGKRKAAVLFVQNDWGQGIQGVFVERFIELGGDVVYNQGFAQDVVDFRTNIAKMNEENPDAVYIPLYPSGAIGAVRQMKELGMDVTIMGGDALDTDEVKKSGVAEGVLYTAGKIGNPDDFKVKVKELTGVDSNLVTPLAYDAMHVLAEAIREAGTTDKAAVRDALENTHYVAGVSFPLISFNEDGDLANAEFQVMEIVNGEGVLLE